jgi:hypothetical protein
LDPTRLFAILSWILLPTVMFGGYSLLTLLVQKKATWFSAERAQFFRAGHAHAGVLLVLSLVYYAYLAQTTFSEGLKFAACLVLLIGILAQSGGFFWHMAVGKPGRLSVGNLVTIGGALLLALATLFLAYGLINAPV